MPIPKDLLDILVCPEYKNAATPAQPLASGLQCETWGRIYPVRDKIPVLIIDQATKSARLIAPAAYKSYSPRILISPRLSLA